MWRSVWLGLACFLCLAITVKGQSLQEVQALLRGLDAAYVLNDADTGAAWQLNEPRCKKRFAPFATLEIPLALAALDARAVRNIEAMTPWNRVKYPLRATDAWELTHWAEDQTMRSAFTNSVEWYWWETAERLGHARLQKALKQFNYGNQFLPATLTACWQDGALQLSAQEQLSFVQRLALETLPLSISWQRHLKEMLLRERGKSYRFYNKTGTGLLLNGQYLGWSVGWLETESGTSVFAFNLTHRELSTVKDAVLQIPKKLLTAAGSWHFNE